MIRRPPRSTLSSSSAASDVYKRQVLFVEGRLADALKASEVGVEAAEQLKDDLGHAHALKIRGVIRSLDKSKQLRGKAYEDAKKDLGQAIQTYHSCGVYLGEAVARLALAEVLLHMQQLTGAKTCYERALKLFKQLSSSSQGAADGRLECHRWLATVCKKLGATHECREHYEEAAKLQRSRRARGAIFPHMLKLSMPNYEKQSSSQKIMNLTLVQPAATGIPLSRARSTPIDLQKKDAKTSRSPRPSPRVSPRSSSKNSPKTPSPKSESSVSPSNVAGGVKMVRPSTGLSPFQRTKLAIEDRSKSDGTLTCGMSSSPRGVRRSLGSPSGGSCSPRGSKNSPRGAQPEEQLQKQPLEEVKGRAKALAAEPVRLERKQSLIPEKPTDNDRKTHRKLKIVTRQAWADPDGLPQVEEPSEKQKQSHKQSEKQQPSAAPAEKQQRSATGTGSLLFQMQRKQQHLLRKQQRSVSADMLQCQKITCVVEPCNTGKFLIRCMLRVEMAQSVSLITERAIRCWQQASKEEVSPNPAEREAQLEANLRDFLDSRTPSPDQSGKSPVASSCLLYTSPSPRDRTRSRMPSSA
eukprot:TRINITY_DN52188_c0_g1_i1.p1 TRINITY_DN52188_c0_g1~~TRINITY_DN52188_c0_g1_i1.p1  ORF type:complete len:580 (-),score=118.12 TRINITY_DN52188_c0_g1_i1:19-1758(-)